MQAQLEGSIQRHQSSFPIRVICQICGKPNDTAQECWHRYDYAQAEDEVPQALATMCINHVPEPNWYVNTDATADMTSSTGNLSSSFSFSGSDKIFIGDGAGFPISRVGNTMLSSKPSN